MKIDAVAGGAWFTPIWKGVAVELGNDKIITRTGRWSRRDSVKNFACEE